MNECLYCVAEADLRVRKIAQARRLATLARADVELVRDCLNADMPIDATLDAINDALRLLDKLLTHCTNTQNT